MAGKVLTWRFSASSSPCPWLLSRGCQVLSLVLREQTPSDSKPAKVMRVLRGFPLSKRITSEVTIVWAKALGSAIIHGFALLMGVTLLLPPATMLRAIVQEEVSTYTFLGKSDVALIICCISLLLEGIRASSAWAVKVRVLNSRWRLLSYGTVVVSVQGVVSMSSPFLCEYMARRNSATFITANQKELADAAVVTMVPLSLLQFLLQISAARYIRRDLGIASSWSLYRHGQAAFCKRWTLKGQIRWRRLPPQLALLSGCFLGLAVFLVELHLIQRPFPFTPVRRCHHGLEGLACRPVSDEMDARPADSFAFWGKGSFGPNRFLGSLIFS